MFSFKQKTQPYLYKSKKKLKRHQPLTCTCLYSAARPLRTPQGGDRARLRWKWCHICSARSSGGPRLIGWGAVSPERPRDLNRR